MKIKLSFIFFLALLLGSCNQEQDELYGGGLVPAVFTPCFAGEDADTNASATAATGTTETADTRATNTTWTANDAIGIYMLDGSDYTLSAALEANKKYRVNNTSTGALVPDDASQTIYYPVDGRNVRFVAYSPYAAAATAAGQATYTFTDQSTRAKQEAIDFIFYRGATDRNNASPAETLTFRHQFSKINITVTRTTNEVSCNGLTVALNRMPAQATVDLAALATNATPAGVNLTALGVGAANTTISPYTSASSDASAAVEAIVAPHTGAGNFTGRAFTFAIGNTTHTYHLPDDATFEPGNVYTFNFALTEEAVELTSTATINNWGSLYGTLPWHTFYALSSTANPHLVGSETTTSTLTIRTKGEATVVPTVTRSTSATNRTAGAPDWLTGATFGPATTSGEWTSRTLTITTTANPLATRRGYIWLAFQGLTCVIKVEQAAPPAVPAASIDGMSNCYVLKNDASSVTFPVTRAYTGGLVNFSVPQSFMEVAILWKDADCIENPTISGSGQLAKITVKSKNVTGNAVIILKQRNNILWSYHIWVTTALPSEMGTWNPKSFGGTTTNPNTVFMGCNLGASAQGVHTGNPGLYYQYGRKDPFTTTAIASTLKSTPYPMDLEATLRYPHIFADSSLSTSLTWWMTTSSSIIETLWCTRDNQKTIYDPCPEGWRVPCLNGNGATEHPFVGVTAKGATTSGSNRFLWLGNTAAASYFPTMGTLTCNSSGDIIPNTASSTYGHYHAGRGLYYQGSGEATSLMINTLQLNPNANPPGSLDSSTPTSFGLGKFVRCVQE